jgi:predicted peptidase
MQNLRIAVFIMTVFICGHTAAQTAKDPLYQAKGDNKRTYWLEEANAESYYRIYVPSAWNASKKFPLVVILHGGGLDENAPFDNEPSDLKGIVFKEAEKHGFILVAPAGGPLLTYPNPYQMPKREGTAARQARPEGEGAAKAQAGQNKVRPTRTVPTNLSAEERKRLSEVGGQDVLNVVELVAREYNVDHSHIYLMGNSMGEIGTLYLAQKYPQKWCAIAPSSGPIDASNYEFANIKGLSGAFFIQGEKDAGGIEPNRVLSEGFKKQGVDTKYVVVKDGTHGGCWYMVLPDIFDFFDQHNCAKK